MWGINISRNSGMDSGLLQVTEFKGLRFSAQSFIGRELSECHQSTLTSSLKDYSDNVLNVLKLRLM